MTQKDKELLIKDISSRIPYGVKGSVYGEGAYETNSIAPNGFISLPNYPPMGMCEILDFKPYLLPLFSMTEEQKKEWYLKDGIIIDDNGYINTKFSYSGDKYIKYFDWLNKNHFDYRGLIDKGLATDATNLNIY